VASTNPRKIELMHRCFGSVYGHTCGECSHLCEGRYHDRILRKCEIYGLTHSEASDWAKGWCACGLLNQPYSGRPIMEQVRHNSMKPKETEQPLENQISFLEDNDG
jgi:hypothetical protein